MFQITLFVILSGIYLVKAGEFCPNSFKFCQYYCCSRGGFCCSECTLSVNEHKDCFDYSLLPGIIGGIISSIFIIIVISIIIAVCCGCIYSNRTGIQRRGRIIRSGNVNATVIHQPAGSIPPVPYGFVQQPGMYPQDKLIYPQDQPGINQTPYPYPPTQIEYQKSSGPPDYTVPSTDPPPYKPRLVTDPK